MDNLILKVVLISLFLVTGFVFTFLRSKASQYDIKKSVLLFAVLVCIGLFLNAQNQSVIDNSDPNTSSIEDSQKIKELKVKIENNPLSVELWNQLGREYILDQNFEKAYQAFNESQQVDFAALFDGYDAAQSKTISDSVRFERLKWLTGLSEARILAQGGRIDDESEKFLSLAMKLDPNNPKGLWYSGLNAAQKGEFQTAKKFWQTLQAQNPPGSLGNVLAARLNGLEQVIAETDRAQENQTNQNAIKPASDSNNIRNTEQWELRLKLVLAEAFSQSATEETQIFISVQQGSNQPPIAAKKISLEEVAEVISLSSENSISSMRGQQNINWDKPLRLNIIWSPKGKVGEKDNINFASLINRDNLAGVNEFILDPASAQQ